MKKIIIILSLVVIFTLSSCGVLVPNSATIELAMGNNATATGTDISDDWEYKDIVFVGFTDDKKFSLKEDKSKKITLNWWGAGEKNFHVTYRMVRTTPTGVEKTNEPGYQQITISNFEDIKYYMFRNLGSDKPLYSKLK